MISWLTEVESFDRRDTTIGSSGRRMRYDMNWFFNEGVEKLRALCVAIADLARSVAEWLNG